MKYRFSSLDQILHSPLFDFSAPCHRPERIEHCTRPTRLESMVFHDACNANGLDTAAPLLADLFHLLYTQVYRWGSQNDLSPKARLAWAHLLDEMQKNALFAALHHLCMGNESAAMQAAHTVQQAISAAVHEIGPSDWQASAGAGKAGTPPRQGRRDAAPHGTGGAGRSGQNAGGNPRRRSVGKYSRADTGRVRHDPGRAA